MSEHEHAKALVKWWDAQAPAWHRRANDLKAIPNGGHRHKATAAKMKAEGVRAGVPDYFLSVRSNCSAGLWIELKKPDGAKPTESQLDELDALTKAGYATAVCWGWEEAAQAIRQYLGKR